MSTWPLSARLEDHQLGYAPPTSIYPGKVLVFCLVNLKLPLVLNPFFCLSDFEDHLFYPVYDNLVPTDPPNLT